MLRKFVEITVSYSLVLDKLRSLFQLKHITVYNIQIVLDK